MNQVGLFEIHQGLVGLFPTVEDAESYLSDMLDTKGQHLHENYYVEDLSPLPDKDIRDMAIEAFHESFSHGGTGLNWDERQLLHEVKEYMGRSELMEFLQEGLSL